MFLDFNQVTAVCSLCSEVLFVEIICMLIMREYQQQRRNCLNPGFYSQDLYSISLSDK